MISYKWDDDRAVVREQWLDSSDGKAMIKELWLKSRGCCDHIHSV